MINYHLDLGKWKWSDHGLKVITGFIEEDVMTDLLPFKTTVTVMLLNMTLPSTSHI